MSSTSSSSSSTGSIGLTGVLFVAFLVLKLTHVISWSWWWVTAPPWIPALVVLAIGIIALIVVFVKAVRR